MPPGAKRTLQSNILPSCTFPCEKVCEACLDIVALDNKVAGLRQALVELEAERFELLSKVNHGHDTITNRLPMEVFSTILKLSLPMPDTLGNKTPRLELLGPLVFSAVSRRWKDIVCSTPSLWTVVPVCTTAIRFHPIVEDLMEEWICRSGQKLLSIIINLDNYHLTPPQFIPRIISECSYRLEYLRMEGKFSMVKSLDFSNLGAQSISTLALAITGSDLTYHPAPQLKLGDGLRPTTLELEYISWRQLGVHADRLTHAHLSWLPTVDCMNLLACAPMMTEFSVYGFKGDNAELASSILHQGLGSLRIECGASRICSILDSLNVPSLLHLELRLWQFSIAANLEVSSRVLLDRVTNCLQRSSASLESLCIQDLPLNPSDDAYSSLGRLMNTTGPSIRHLTIKVAQAGHLQWDLPESPQQLIDSIFHEERRLPHLKSITVNGFPEIWLHCFKALLLSISHFISSNGARPILLVMPFLANPLNTDYHKDVPPDVYRDGTLQLPGAEIGEMLSLSKELDITIKMPITAYQREQDDVFPDVLDALTRLSLEE
ncbi:hypothetical protein D9619_002419 [Psilocybe cf. subviscida]|uniref:F-box domain-containing protein n=1 Tax=Psilocybe cf. subviscida TaxID=2480587 RepID=A0A8H5AYD9_9AGAR|nr:hypothetical protein D9619_002419 [Psilocybe cf. subviscida]